MCVAHCLAGIVGHFADGNLRYVHCMRVVAVICEYLHSVIVDLPAPLVLIVEIVGHNINLRIFDQ